MTLERFLILTMLACPVVLTSLLVWMIAHALFAFMFAIGASGLAGYGLGLFKADLDREERIQKRWGPI